MSGAAFPPELKPYKRFLVQANQIGKVDPKVAYYCRLFALTKMLAKPDQGGLPNQKDPTIRKLVDGIMIKLETEKKAFEEPLDPESDFDAVQNMAENVFATADSQDRDGMSTIQTSHAFMTAFVLFEVLEYFSEKNVKADAEVQQKLKYAKWKAADIAKAIKEGRTPSRGGPNEKPGDELDELGKELEDEDSVKPSKKPGLDSFGGGPAPYESKYNDRLPAPDDEEDGPSTGGSSKLDADLPPPPKGISFKKLPGLSPVNTGPKADESELPSYFSLGTPEKNEMDETAKTPRGATARKMSVVADKVKKSRQGINKKDAAKLKKLKEIEVIAREALSAIRFNDTPTAKAKLREALSELAKI